MEKGEGRGTISKGMGSREEEGREEGGKLGKGRGG